MGEGVALLILLACAEVVESHVRRAGERVLRELRRCLRCLRRLLLLLLQLKGAMKPRSSECDGWPGSLAREWRSLKVLLRFDPSLGCGRGTTCHGVEVGSFDGGRKQHIDVCFE